MTETRRILRFTGMTLMMLAACFAGAAERVTVFTVNYPLAYFTQQIGGDHVEVIFPVPGDVDPAFWQPETADIAAIQNADLILLNGADYAKWVKQASLPRRKLVNTSTAFKSDYIRVTDTVTHQHGPGGEHSHAGTAFTTWLDFNQATKQAAAIRAALERKVPEHAAFFEDNYRSLERELRTLDESAAAIVARDPEKRFLASHPVYQYFARRYGVNIESVTWEPETVPDDGQWHALRHRLDSHAAGWMIWEGRPLDQTVKELQAIGIDSLVFDPVANSPESGDFISVMKSNIMELERAYRD